MLAWTVAGVVVLVVLVAAAVMIFRVLVLVDGRELEDDSEVALAHDSAWGLDSDFD